MTVRRARILKAPPEDAEAKGAPANATRPYAGPLARRIPALIVDGRAEAERIVADARASVASIAETAGREARDREIARVAAEYLGHKISEEQRAERDLDRTIELATLLAERLIGEAIAIEPSRVTALAKGALLETRGARHVRVEACKEDVVALEALFADVGPGVVQVDAATELARGSLVVHTELGRIDARLAPQLALLAEALREMLARGDVAKPVERK